MKACSTCRMSKGDGEYGIHRGRPDGLQNQCKVCRRKIANASSGAQRISNLRRIARNRQFILEYLMSHSCVDCGEGDILVLQFDHLVDKIRNVTEMINRTCSIEKIEAEIDKCEVVCANDHARRTARRASSWRIAAQEAQGARR